MSSSPHLPSLTATTTSPSLALKGAKALLIAPSLPHCDDYESSLALSKAKNRLVAAIPWLHSKDHSIGSLPYSAWYSSKRKGQSCLPLRRISLPVAMAPDDQATSLLRAKNRLVAAIPWLHSKDHSIGSLPYSAWSLSKRKGQSCLPLRRISLPVAVAPDDQAASLLRLRAANSSPAALIRALSSLRSAVVAWARSCPHPPTALISDWFLGWTNNLATDLSVPNLVFYCSNAFAVSAIDFLWRTMPSASASHVTLSALPSTPSFPYSRLPAIIRGYVAGDPDWEFTRESFLAIPAAWGAAINTFAALDDRYLAHLRRSFGHDRVWAVGPIQLEAAPSDRGGATSISAEEVTAWLDACPPRSVVYICFGSQYTETAAEIGAIAAALERSGVRFVWVIGSGADLPEGFEAGEMGMLIRGWAPQAAILGHAGVGAFVTHCGWNSVMEAAATGVLLLTWPMTAEQFLNAWLLVEVAGVAVRVGEGGGVPATEDLAKLLVESVSESEAWTEVFRLASQDETFHCCLVLQTVELQFR
ncbi:hypothetical protein ZIOFF_040651 [Zingiber officinale]|uniref:Uncharacterized protein n=1 Tax=Zingiber officinale TaxID=94328 RepID=A0A8J5G6I4_ZINOF|nr:hypothetical protein ZIOFF_040651 [Zingiber officinale]